MLLGLGSLERIYQNLSYTQNTHVYTMHCTAESDVQQQTVILMAFIIKLMTSPGECNKSNSSMTHHSMCPVVVVDLDTIRQSA